MTEHDQLHEDIREIRADVLSAKTDSTSNLTAGVDDIKIVVFYTAAAGGAVQATLPMTGIGN